MFITRLHSVRMPTTRGRLEYLQPTHTPRSVDVPFKDLRAHSTYRGQGTGGCCVRRKEAAPLSIRKPHPRPLMALSRRFRSCAETPALPKSPGSCTAVPCTSIPSRTAVAPATGITQRENPSKPPAGNIPKGNGTGLANHPVAARALSVPVKLYHLVSQVKRRLITMFPLVKYESFEQSMPQWRLIP